MVLLKFILYVILFYYAFIYISKKLINLFLKRWINKINKDLHKQSNRSNFQKHSNGETEFSHEKEKVVDPGGDYVDFEEIKD